MSVSLSIASHTNVGKTTLVRTLLKRDIGEVADRPHVTESAERHTLLDSAGGDVLYLWDTPGFGDSARLLARLRSSGNPLGWLMTQVWDRLADRPFFCSQQAFRNVRDESDVVLYLVNAAEDPASAAYVGIELEILRWMGKPVLLLLNQAGAPRGAAAEAADEARWAGHLARHVGEGAVVTLDAFARCWVQEDRLLREAAALLPAEKRAEMERLRTAWRQRNLQVFGASMRSLAAHLAALAADRETVPDRLDAGALAQRVKAWVARARDRQAGDPAVERAMSQLASRLALAARDDMDRLIALHGLSGHAKEAIIARTVGNFDVVKPADVAGAGVVGGLLSGAAGGLAADLASGGLTLGAGMLVGAVLGALGAGSAVRAYNVLQGQEDGRVRWGAEFLAGAARAALLGYLAVAHYGRGRGNWVEGEAPAHWGATVDQALRDNASAWDPAWQRASVDAPAGELAASLEAAFDATARDVLQRLYPDARQILAR